MTTKSKKIVKKVKSVKKLLFKEGEIVFTKLPIEITKLIGAKHSYLVVPATVSRVVGDVVFVEIEGLKKLISITSDLILTKKDFVKFLEAISSK